MPCLKQRCLRTHASGTQLHSGAAAEWTATRVDSDWGDVPGDGSCFYHAIFNYYVHSSQRRVLVRLYAHIARLLGDDAIQCPFGVDSGYVQQYSNGRYHFGAAGNAAISRDFRSLLARLVAKGCGPHRAMLQHAYETALVEDATPHSVFHYRRDGVSAPNAETMALAHRVGYEVRDRIENRAGKQLTTGEEAAYMQQALNRMVEGLADPSNYADDADRELMRELLEHPAVQGGIVVTHTPPHSAGVQPGVVYMRNPNIIHFEFAKVHAQYRVVEERTEELEHIHQQPVPQPVPQPALQSELAPEPASDRRALIAQRALARYHQMTPEQAEAAKERALARHAAMTLQHRGAAAARLVARAEAEARR